MKKTVFILFIQSIMMSSLFSQEKTDVDLIKENTFYFEIEEDRPSGEGFDI